MADTNLPDVNKYDDPKLYEDITGGLPSIGGKLQGTRPEDYDTYARQTKEILDKLEHRYDDPNWWKVAAGFAKPQLGGFLASAGSAAQAMGENTELKRAQELPIARARAQLGLQGILGARAKGQQTKWNSLNEEDLKNPMKLKDIIAEGPDTDIGKTASRMLQDISTSLQNVNTNLSNVGAAEKLASTYPILHDSMQKLAQTYADPNSTDEQRKAASEENKKNQDAARPPHIDSNAWKNMGWQEKQNLIDSYQVDMKNLGLNEEQKLKNKAESSFEGLSKLSTVRDLVQGVGLPEVTTIENGKPVKHNGKWQMDKILGTFGGNDVLDLFGKAAAEGRLGDKFKEIDNLFTQGKVSPEARPAWETLKKQLATLQIDMRGASTNPTDAYSSLVKNSQPNERQGQEGITRIIDIMAHDAKRHIHNARYGVTNKLSAHDMLYNDPAFNSIQRELDAERAGIGSKMSETNRPYYYDPYSNRPEKKAPPAVDNTKTPAASPSGHGPAVKTKVVGGHTWYMDANGKTWSQ